MRDDTIQDLYQNMEKLRRRIEALERTESVAVLDGYLNFSGAGETGYGFRDNSGAMEVKNDGVAWYSIARSNIATISFYVDGAAGSDTTGDGTISAPYATIGKALAMLPVLITATVNIYVAISTYAENLDFSGYLGNVTISILPYDPIAGKAMFTSNTLATSGKVSGTTIGSSALDLADLSGGKVWITAGLGKGQVRDIDSNDATTITVTSAWGTTPDTTSRFSCCGPVKISTAATYAITSAGKSFRLFGLWVVAGGTYAVYAQQYANAALYSCYIEPTVNGIQFANFAFGTIQYNCIELIADSVYGVMIQASSNVTAFGNVITSVSATGTYGIRLTYGSYLYAGLNTTTYPYNYLSGLYIGILLSSGSTATALPSQTYSGCTTNYDMSLLTDKITAGHLLLTDSASMNETYRLDVDGYTRFQDDVWISDQEYRGTYCTQAVFTKALTDNSATGVFSVTTTNETGDLDGGGWALRLHVLITDGSKSAGNVATKSLEAMVTRAMKYTGTGSCSSVSEVTETGSVSTDPTAVDIGTLTVSTSETSEYVTAINVLADHTGTQASNLRAIVLAELLWYAFNTRPTLTAL